MLLCHSVKLLYFSYGDKSASAVFDEIVYRDKYRSLVLYRTAQNS